MIKLAKKCKKFIDKWLKALRSGQYEQTIHQLCLIDETGPRYCCLGVACEILGATPQEMHDLRAGLPEELELDIPEFFLKDSLAYEFFTTYLPALNDAEKVSVMGSRYQADGEFHSFEEIADIIEKHVTYE